jgi:hypothetical protein
MHDLRLRTRMKDEAVELASDHAHRVHEHRRRMPLRVVAGNDPARAAGDRAQQQADDRR